MAASSCPTANDGTSIMPMQAAGSRYQCMALAASFQSGNPFIIACPTDQVISVFIYDTSARGKNSFKLTSSIVDLVSWSCGQIWEKRVEAFCLVMRINFYFNMYAPCMFDVYVYKIFLMCANIAIYKNLL